MSWFNFFQEKTTQPHHAFGRGINASLSPDEEDFFNKSSKSFEQKEILNAYKHFFDSLENFTDGTSNENIKYSLENDVLHFTIYQGTAKIIGRINDEYLYAESIICKKSQANVALKRHLLDRNYQLTYANFFMDDEYVKIKVYHDNITMTPQKIFFPLREISLNADFDKEYVTSEFKGVEIEEIEHLQSVNETELRIKYDFLKKTLENTISKIDGLPSNDNSGMQSFLLLNSLYMIDYLLVPKYDIYHKISKKIQEYFSDQTSPIESKNDELKEYVIELQQMGYEEFCANNYNAKYTFNPTEKTSKEDMDTFIGESLIKIRWYKNNRYNQIIPTIYKYIAFYILYNYGINPIIRKLLHILIEVQNQEFFISLGYEKLYDEKNNIFMQKNVISAIDEIIKPHQKRYKLLETFGEELKYSSLNEFSNSFYIQIQNLNFEEI